MSDKKNFEIDAESAITLEIDACGLNCPLPLLKAKQGLHQVEQGQFIRVQATDAGSVRDFHSFAELSSHHLVSFSEDNGQYTYILQKA